MKILKLVLIDALILTAFVVFVGGNSSFVVDPPVIKETVNDVVVPPVLGSVEDLASVDDDDILRDDVERMLAEEFGNDPAFYLRVREYAIMTQIIILNPTSSNIAKYGNFLHCMRDSRILDAAIVVDNFTIDTEERKRVYYEVFRVLARSVIDTSC